MADIRGEKKKDPTVPKVWKGELEGERGKKKKGEEVEA